jgi:hypothetical protein
VVAAAGDISCPQEPDGSSTCRDEATSGLILADPTINYVLALGDNQYDHGTLDEYLRYYEETWGRLKTKTRPITGNWDFAGGYYEYWGTLAGDRGKGYYAFDLGEWRAYAINSSIRADPQSGQYSWLEEDLEAHPKPCVLAYWHHPRWSSGRNGSSEFMKPIWDLLYDNGADLVLTAHDHDYERFAPLNKLGRIDLLNGIREIVVGTGGRSLSGFEEILPGSERHDNTSYGILKLELGPGFYSFEFVPATGTFRDSGSGHCH